MNILKKILKITGVSSFLLACFMFSGGTASAQDYKMHSGVDCSAANQAQAGLMTWNKDGLTNNSPWHLYVICPVDINYYAWTSWGANQAKLSLNASIFMPPGYTNFSNGTPTGPFCSLRFGKSAGNIQPTDNITFDVVGNFTVGYFSGSTTNGDTDSGIYNATIPVSISTEHSAHMLCLLPKNGGTLHHYFARQYN